MLDKISLNITRVSDIFVLILCIKVTKNKDTTLN
jgi:hypothetical protein